jgi:hypothetical protein
MKAILDRAKTKQAAALASMKRYPVLFRALGLFVVVALYVAGLLTLNAFVKQSMMPLVLTGAYFLPAVLRAWMLFYWAARDEVRSLRSGKQNAA